MLIHLKEEMGPSQISITSQKINTSCFSRLREKCSGPRKGRQTDYPLELPFCRNLIVFGIVEDGRLVERFNG